MALREEDKEWYEALKKNETGMGLVYAGKDPLTGLKLGTGSIGRVAQIQNSLNHLKAGAPQINRSELDLTDPDEFKVAWEAEQYLPWKTRAARGRAEANAAASAVLANNPEFFDTTRSDAAKVYQNAAMDKMQARSGNPNSVQQKLGNLAAQDKAAELFAATRSGNPVATSLAFRSSAPRDAAMKGAADALGEDLRTQEALVNAINQARAQDISQQALKADLVKGYREQGLSLDEAIVQAETEIAAANRAAAQAGADRKAKTTNAIVGGAAQVIGSGGAMMSSMFSDKKLKKNIQDGDGSAKEFLDAIGAKNFKYKGDNEDFLGIMAQDAERSKLGKDIVRDTPEGKTIPFDKAVMALLASTAHLNKRLSKLEGKKNG